MYEIPCEDCAQVYVGETGRTLKKRISEHKQAVKRFDDKNGIAVHHFKHNHRIAWDEATVSPLETSYWRRRVQEAINIRTKKETMNLDCGLTLSNTWLPSLELCRTSSWLNLFNFSLHPSLPVLSNYQQHVLYIPAVLSFSQLCNVIADEGSRAETSYIDVILYAMSNARKNYLTVKVGLVTLQLAWVCLEEKWGVTGHIVCVATRLLTSLGKSCNLFRTTVSGAERDLLSLHWVTATNAAFAPIASVHISMYKISHIKVWEMLTSLQEHLAAICLVSVGLELWHSSLICARFWY